MHLFIDRISIHERILTAEECFQKRYCIGIKGYQKISKDLIPTFYLFDCFIL